MAANVAQAEESRHVAKYETTMCRTRVHWLTCASARVCVCTHVCACVCNKGESTMLRIFANSLITHTLYTRDFYFIFFMWDFILFLICACDVIVRGAFDHTIKTQLVIFT